MPRPRRLKFKLALVAILLLIAGGFALCIMLERGITTPLHFTVEGITENADHTQVLLVRAENTSVLPVRFYSTIKLRHINHELFMESVHSTEHLPDDTSIIRSGQSIAFKAGLVGAPVTLEEMQPTRVDYHWAPPMHSCYVSFYFFAQERFPKWLAGLLPESRYYKPEQIAPAFPSLPLPPATAAQP